MVLLSVIKILQCHEWHYQKFLQLIDT